MFSFTFDACILFPWSIKMVAPQPMSVFILRLNHCARLRWHPGPLPSWAHGVQTVYTVFTLCSTFPVVQSLIMHSPLSLGNIIEHRASFSTDGAPPITLHELSEMNPTTGVMDGLVPEWPSGFISPDLNHGCSTAWRCQHQG